MSSSHNRADSEAADALAELAQNVPRRSISVSSSHDTAALPPFSPTAVEGPTPLKREESQEPKLPPLSILLGAVQQDTKQESVTTAAIPLFVPAQVDRKVERKESVATNVTRPASSKNSSSPAPTNTTTSEIKNMSEEDSQAAQLGLRGLHKTSEPKSVPSTEPTGPKKRAAPKSVASRKKGTAQRSAGPSKRRKVDPDTPTSNDTRDTTPASRTGRGGVKIRNSMTPALESSPGISHESEGDDDEDDVDSAEDEETVFCICRKPDDHHYMIACDAGCDDWFHGRCVKISQDEGKLIDKYICPNCEARGKGVTTWKPMCRRATCRKPARLTNSEISKYCSQDCGLRFFSELISRGSEDAKAKPKRGKGKNSATDLADSRSGPIDPFQLKALVDSVEDSKAFRILGNGILHPLSPGLSKTFSSLSIPTNTDPAQTAILTPAEQTEVDQITERKDALRDTRAALEDRKRYFALAKDRLNAHIDGAKLKPKDVCGFDQRLSWSTEHFQRWRHSPAGVAAFENGSLEPQHMNGTGDHMEIDGDGDEGISICLRKRCERHKMWQRLQVEESRFEESGLADQMREYDRLEKEVRERAAMRARREVSGLLETQGNVVPASATA
jgi:COMPASS component SPP1